MSSACKFVDEHLSLRRNGLLAGTTLAAAAALALAALVAPAQAQAPTAQRPNILVIFGDDIGQSNISAYTHGLVGYKTPNIDRIAKEGMMFTDYYAENSCTAGRSSFITGQTPKRTGLSKVGIPGRAGRPPGSRHHHRAGAQAARLRDGPVRQEPSRRPRRVPADETRLRRVLRQPLSPQRRGGAGAPVLAEERHRLRQGQLAARRAQSVRRRQDRGHRAADPQADGDDRRRDHRRRDRLHAPGRCAPTGRSSPG